MTPTQLAAAAEIARFKRARNNLTRDSISAPKLIDEIEQLKEKLTSCEPADIQRLVAIANINFGLLKKVMPDLKPQEVTVDEKEATIINIDSSKYAEIRQKMLDNVDI